MSTCHRALAELATHYWKLCENLASRCTDPDGHDAAMLRYSRGRLDAILGGEDMVLRCYDAQEWNATLPAVAVNPDEIGGGAALVERTLEPTVLHGGNIILPGKVMLSSRPAEGE
jgi:hypothetical protein